MSNRLRDSNQIAALGFLLALLALPAFGLASAGCAHEEPGEGVAIYLLHGDVRPSTLPELSHLQLPADPIVAGDDLISYLQGTHEFEVSADAFEALSRLQVPTEGLAFAVTVDRSPVYAGAFMTPFSSSSYYGVVIVQTLGFQAISARYWIGVDLGYPGAEWFKGSDPRNDAGLLKALAQEGKLE
jgi:hypothetical protein